MYTFLGMDVTITNNKEMKVEMKDQLNEAIDMFVSYKGGAIIESVTSTAQKYVRIVNE